MLLLPICQKPVTSFINVKREGSMVSRGSSETVLSLLCACPSRAGGGVWARGWAPPGSGPFPVFPPGLRPRARGRPMCPGCDPAPPAQPSGWPCLPKPDILLEAESALGQAGAAVHRRCPCTSDHRDHSQVLSHQHRPCPSQSPAPASPPEMQALGPRALPLAGVSLGA